jgi:hypothetical protein
VGGDDCTTKFENTHRIVRREVLYRLHLWFGRRVFVHEVVNKAAASSVFRCTFDGSEIGRYHGAHERSRIEFEVHAPGSISVHVGRDAVARTDDKVAKRCRGGPGGKSSCEADSRLDVSVHLWVKGDLYIPRRSIELVGIGEKRLTFADARSDGYSLCKVPRELFAEADAEAVRSVLTSGITDDPSKRSELALDVCAFARYATTVLGKENNASKATRKTKV